jgi:16S rRNA (cytosine967-C5)-methyltransferase
LLRAVDSQDAYANLVLPRLIAEHRLSGRDAALATELGYGTVRAAGVLDEIVDACLDRPEVQPQVRDLLRLGAYQALRTRIPPHATVATTVELARRTGSGRAAGLVNAVLRKVVAADWAAWTDRLGAGAGPERRLALSTAHPEWVVAAFADALGERPDGGEGGLGGDGGERAEGADGDEGAEELAETGRALRADDERPQTHLVAWPGRCDRDELVARSGGSPGPYSPYAVRLDGGDPAGLDAVREHRAGVQDEGSQLCAVALVNAPLAGRDERWLDLCAGPGGKAALLAALGAERGARLTANELRPHRARLVRNLCRPWDVEVRVGDARAFPTLPGGYDRILLDAPCTGLGALRRRPEARWRRRPDDVPALAALQRELLAAALRLLRPGGVLGYVTCSPHPEETRAIVAGTDLLDARPAFPAVPLLGPGPTVQLWPHRHGTDAMFCALIRGS